MTIEAVIWDIGNVLLEWQPERFYDRAIGEARRQDFFAAVDLTAMNERVDRGETFAEVIGETAAANPDWAHEIMMWHDRWIEMASPAIDASVRLLRALRRAGVPCFALSNFGIQTFEIAIREYPFLEEFDRCVISGKLGAIKPEPEIYEALEAECGLTGEALIFTDDRPDNIAAAEARGWRTHLFQGPDAWAARLVSEGLLTEEDIA